MIWKSERVRVISHEKWFNLYKVTKYEKGAGRQLLSSYSKPVFHNIEMLDEANKVMRRKRRILSTNFDPKSKGNQIQ